VLLARMPAPLKSACHALSTLSFDEEGPTSRYSQLGRVVLTVFPNSNRHGLSTPRATVLVAEL
jgi:hypothetical protein